MEKTIEDFYNQMCKVSNDLNDIIIPHINKNKPMSYFQIGVIIKMGNLNLDCIYETALNTYRKLPMKEKKTLREKYRPIRKEMRDKFILEHDCENYSEDDSDFWSRFIKYTTDILFLDNTTSFNASLLHKKYNDDYSLIAKAYKDLNEMLFSHINKSHILSDDQIWCIIPLIRQCLFTLRDRAYDVYDEFNEMTKHMLYDEYFYSNECKQYIDELNSINYELRGKKVGIPTDIYDDEHEYWKAERVEYLNETYNPYGTEQGYVEENMMYNDNY